MSFSDSRLLPRKCFQTLNFVFYGMLFSQLSFLTMTLYLQNTGSTTISTGFSSPFSIVVPSLTVICLLVPKLLYELQIKQAINKPSLSDKLQHFQTGSIIKLAMTQGASLFSIVVFLLTGEIWFLAFTMLLLAVFISARPNQATFINDLTLLPKEVASLDSNEV